MTDDPRLYEPTMWAKRRSFAYSSDDFTHHAIPVALVILGAVVSIFDEPDDVIKPENLRDLVDEVGAVALEAGVT
jgi:hypothetical protein